jgi:O-antigen/teichoic acid export membrane protein
VQGEQRFDRLLVLRLVTQGSYILSIIFLIVLGLTSLQQILYAYVLSAVFASTFSLLIGWARVGSIRFRTPACIRELFHFGKYSVGTTSSSNLFGTSNTYIINFMIGPEALAVYNLGQRLIELVEIPLRSFAATGMPELSAAYNQENKKQVISIMKRYTGLITVALVPVCLGAILFADVAIGIIGGSKYLATETANILRTLMIISLLYPLDRFFALTLDAIHQPKINFIKVLIMLAASVTVTFLGIYTTGSVYAVAVVVPTLIGVEIGYWGLNRYSPFALKSILQTGYLDTLQLVEDYRLKLFRRKN